MKKFISTFIILIVISFTIFAQNTPKLIWEKKVLEINHSPNFVFNTNGINLSPEGNILVRASYSNMTNDKNEYNTKSFDKNGNLIWSASDYTKTKNPTFVTKYYKDKYLYIESSSKNFNRDTILYFDKNFTYLKTFNTNLPNTYALDVEDGVIYATTDKKFIKYDLNGKEEWQYQNDEPTILVNSVAPYIGLEGNAGIQKKNMLILNKNGKKIGRTEPQVYYKTYSTPDKGFWLLTDQNYTQAEYIKFDSTGKQTAKFTATDLPARWQSDVVIRLNVMKNNGLFSVYMNDKAEIVFLQMMPDGSLKKSVKNLNIKDVRDERITFNYSLTDENSCMFFCSYVKVSQSSGNNFIGVAKFDDANLGWSKQIGETVYGNNIRFNLDDEKVFCIIDEYALTRNFTIHGKLTIYNLDGSLRWKQSDQSQPGVIDFKKVNDVLYIKHIITTNEFVTKVRYSDGTLIWIKPVIINLLATDSKSDNLGNTYIKYTYCPDSSYSSCSKRYSKIVISNKNDDVIGEYNEPTLNNSSLIDFDIDKDNNLVTLSMESVNGKVNNSYTLRKIKFCGNSFGIAPPQISGNTDACPGEKVKLSIPKIEGVSYQWQKDGKDLLTEGKDAVQDVGISGAYTVTIKDLTCLNSVTSKELKVNIRSLPNTEIKTAKLTFCQGDKTTITSSTNGTFFQWQKDEKDITNATAANFEVTQSGQYRLGVKDEKCPQIGYSNIIPIEVKPLPDAIISSDIKSVIVEPFTVKMTANAGTGLTYQWAKNDTAIVNATTAIYETKKTGKFTVIVTKDGCSKTSEPLLISIQIALANETEIGEDEVKVYPNPSRGEFNIILPNALKGADIQLFNLLGQEHTLIHTGDILQAQNIMQGTYFLRVSKGEKVITSKVVVY
jgi:Secretion system C-terminal sorting domain